MRFESFFTETSTFTHHVRAYETGNGGVNVYNRTAREVQRAISRQESARPHHVRDRQVREGQPNHGENQDRRETNTFSQTTDYQRHGDTGEGTLERHMNQLR